MDSRLTNLLNLPGIRVESESHHYLKNSVLFELSICATGMKCAYCCTYTEELHQTRPIIVKDLPFYGQDVYLKLPRRQFYCKVCQRYITERLQFIDWRRKHTQRYEERIYNQVNSSNIEQVSKQQHLPIKQVKNIFNYINQKRKRQKQFELKKKMLWDDLLILSHRYSP
jgi:transposase